MQTQDIARKIRAAFPDAEVELTDTTGGGDHFEATVVSAAFVGKSMLEQHRMVYAALAEEMLLAPVEVFEVATFYARFLILREGDPDPPPITVRVCDSLTCELLGAGPLRKELEETLDGKVRIIRTSCVGRCERAPVACIGEHAVGNATAAAVGEAVSAGLTAPETPAYQDLDAFRAWEAAR